MIPAGKYKYLVTATAPGCKTARFAGTLDLDTDCTQQDVHDIVMGNLWHTRKEPVLFADGLKVAIKLS
ncbi:hypothetical protein ACTWP5_27650 [Streptomyces sp. 4N509B]|uniref:hypothetical protein n=1 Tax=Streptomyces sp. 4N509B TaxID=3457413 RepID=UPI003FD5BE16